MVISYSCYPIDKVVRQGEINLEIKISIYSKQILKELKDLKFNHICLF